MPDIFRILPHDDAELAAFRALLLEYEESLPEDLRISDLDAELRTLPERYAAPAAAMFLAREEDENVGCIIVTAKDETTAEIKRLYVAPQARRSGAGKALVQAAIAFAKSRGHARVVLDTERERLSAAYRLYRSLGFSECAPYGTTDYANPTFMELALQ